MVAWLGAVQSQDYYGGTWAIGLRVRGLTAADVDAAFDAGRILRTHVLRPTWHFVHPEDIGWMLALTGPKIRALNLRYGATIGLDARAFGRARDVMARALEGGRFLTRPELATALRRARVIEASATGQTLAHLVMAAEQEGVLCSGPRRGKQFTYALMAERAPQAIRAMQQTSHHGVGRRGAAARDEALARLAQRYFTSRAPATVDDFAWWSGLTKSAARLGIAAAGIAKADVAEASPPSDGAAGQHFLLPNFDEYVIAYRHRDALLNGASARNLGVWSTMHYPHYVIINGRIAGSWQRSIAQSTATVRLKMREPLSRPQLARIRTLAKRYAQFIGATESLVVHA